MSHLYRSQIIKISCSLLIYTLLGISACNLNLPFPTIEKSNTPSATPTLLPTSTPTPTSTLTPTSTPIPTSTLPPSADELTYITNPSEAISLLAPHSDRGDIDGPNDSNESSSFFSDAVLEEAGIEYIHLTNSEDLDHAYQTMIDQMYQYAHQSRGSELKLKSDRVVNGVRTKSGVTGVVNSVQDRVVTEAQLIEVEKWLDAKGIDFRYYPGSLGAPVIVFFYEKDFFVISEVMNLTFIDKGLENDKIKSYGIGDTLYGLVFVVDSLWRAQAKAGDSLGFNEAYKALGATATPFIIPKGPDKGKEAEHFDFSTIRVIVQFK